MSSGTKYFIKIGSLIALAAVCAFFLSTRPDKSAWTPERIELHQKPDDGGLTGPDTIYLKNGKKIEGLGYELKFFREVKAKGYPSYLLFAGYDCTACDRDLRLFLYSPLSGQTIAFAAPGKREIDYNNSKIHIDNQLFWGNCVEGRPNSLISVSHDEGDADLFTMNKDGSVSQTDFSGKSFSGCEELKL